MSLFPKKCACGRSYLDRAAWEQLPLAGNGTRLYSGSGVDRLEHRNCACGSTLVLPAPEPSVIALLAHDVCMPHPFRSTGPTDNLCLDCGDVDGQGVHRDEPGGGR